jgi:amidase/aspartyl-tRNA(Asn)/glutamyl-tRNA(Gln) amidotransferase subunit A
VSPPEPAYASAAELAGWIRRRQISPVEAMDAAIERIQRDNRRLNALVHLDLDQARRRAREAERAVMAGEALGPLHGVPTAMKDLFDFKPGWPSTFGGVRALKDFVPDFWCAWAERMERGGAIIVGKTNSPVMGFRGTCDNPLFGPSRNPFDTARNTGGSSGGSAAVVAAGMLPLAEGTDGGGSVRIPASWCGVYGYKQSFGRVPYIARPNGFTGLHPFLSEGVLTRTVEDAALFLDTVAGHDARDPFALDEPAAFSGTVRASIRGLRIAYSPDFDVFPVDGRVRKAVGAAVLAFEEAGARVEEVKLGIGHDQRELSDLWCRLIIPINVETFESFKAQGLDLLAEHRDDFPPEYLRWIDEGYRLTVPQLMRDEEMRTEVYDAIDAGLPAGGERRRREHEGAVVDRRGRGRSADRLVPHLPGELLGSPGGVGAGGHGGGAAGGDAAHRAALRGRRRPRGQRGLRADQALEGHVSPDRALRCG